MKNIYCNHWRKENEKTYTYIYELIGCDLNLCKKCEKKLRKQIIEQIEVEK